MLWYRILHYFLFLLFVLNAESFWPNAPFHFPIISISFLLLWACCANCSALAISKTSRRRWKVRSREMGGSSARLSLSGASWRPPRAFSAPRSTGLAGLSSGRRGSGSCCSNARKKLAATSSGERRLPLLPAGGEEAGESGAAGLLLRLPRRRKYSSPMRSRTGRACGCWGCDEGWKKSRGWGCCEACRAPGTGPRLRRALHGGQGRRATSRTPADTSSGSRMLGALGAAPRWAEGGTRERKKGRVDQSWAQLGGALGMGGLPTGRHPQTWLGGSGGRCPRCWSAQTRTSRVGGRPRRGARKGTPAGLGAKAQPLVRPDWLFLRDSRRDGPWVPFVTVPQTNPPSSREDLQI